ncbi:MAG: excinuclease ABC subunit UvrC [Bacilli bacterium]|nr:excinuclease ABC subunit UvrC [Bacilli bacterium]
MFKNELDLVPSKPGSYQMYNNNDVIIYIGKAKDLKKRLSSYFRGKNSGKTAKMISEISYFKYIITDSELEAFILELNLIKEYSPKYNILLKDDKSYPYIEYTKKPFPSLRIVRYLKVKKHKDKILFGPYVNAYAARRIVNLINRLYPLKKCPGMPKEVCLYYHIKECLGYCVKEISEDEITKMETEILSFLRGNEKIIKNKIIEKLEYYSKEMNYELALELKNELEYIEIVLEKQKVEFLNKENIDVVNYYFDNVYLAIEFLFIRSGKLIGTFNDIFTVTDNYIEEVETYIALFYQKKEIPTEIYFPEELNLETLKSVLKSKVLTAERGKKKKLLLLAKDNAKINHQNNFKKAQLKLERTKGANEELSALLGININRIDIFDNSNLFGSFSVSGMVVFINGEPAKNKYRKYKIVLGKNDDFNTMKEVIYRRYQRALLNNEELPELIIVDGGVNQIRATNEVLDALLLDIKVCGLVKNKYHKTNDLIDGKSLESYNIDKTSNLFHYLTRIQDEVHRYTINYHKQIRSKGSISSVLDNIPGIGNVRKKELIKAFGSVKNMKDKSINELAKHLPLKIATNLYDFLKELD